MNELVEPPSPTIEECPPGAYRDMSMSDYLRINAINNSGLTKFLRSPAHYVASLAEREETDAMALGTMVHTSILEPDSLDIRYIVADQCSAVTAKGTRCTNGGILIGGDGWRCGVHKNGASQPMAKVVSREDFDKAIGIGESVRRHPFASKILASQGPTELVCVWVDPASGLRCKARIDKLSLPYSYVGDLKTTQDSRTEPFRESAYKFGYMRQAAFNLMGLAAVGLPTAGFAVISVETAPPYAVAVYCIEPDEEEFARKELAEAMSRFAECKRKYKTLAEWPAYDTGIQPLTRPERIKRAEKFNR